MKKIFSIAIITLFAFTLTACRNKDLEVTCTKEGEKIVFNYENNQIVKQYTETTQTYNNESLLNMAYQTTQMRVSAYNTMKGVSAEIIKNNNSITLKVTFDIKNMLNEDLKGVELKQKPKNLIKEYKKIGYTCTTK